MTVAVAGPYAPYRPRVQDRSCCPASQHGTRNAAHNHGCICKDATADKSAYESARLDGTLPRRFTDALGAVRRLRALAFMGWSQRELAGRYGLASKTQIGTWMAADLIHVDNDALVRRMFDDLCMTLGPSPRTRMYAQSRGWCGPLDWDDIDRDEAPAAIAESGPPHAEVDWVKVDRCAAGSLHSSQLTFAERHAVLDRPAVQRMSLSQVEEHTGLDTQFVFRHRKAASAGVAA